MGGASYKYDGLNNRVQQTVGANVTKYLLDIQPGLSVVLAETTGANVIRNVHSLRGIHAHKDAGGAWEWMMQDGLGSVRGVVDNTVGVLWSGSPAPYGEYFGESGTRQTNFGFTGEYTDPTTQLVHLRARDYNPAIGVFTALDPFEGMADRPMSLNGYSWVEGNVPNMGDPSGMIASPAVWNACFAQSTPIPMSDAQIKSTILASTATISIGGYGPDMDTTTHESNDTSCGISDNCFAWDTGLGTLVYERTILTHNHWTEWVIPQAKWVGFRGPNGYLHVEWNDIKYEKFGEYMRLFTIAPTSSLTGKAYDIGRTGLIQANVAPKDTSFVIGSNLTVGTNLYYSYWDQSGGRTWALGGERAPQRVHGFPWSWVDVKIGELTGPSAPRESDGVVFFQLYTNSFYVPQGSSGGGVYTTLDGTPRLIGVNIRSAPDLMLFAGVAR